MIHSYDKLVSKEPDFKNYIWNIVKQTKAKSHIYVQVKILATLDKLRAWTIFDDQFLDEMNVVFFEVNTFNTRASDCQLRPDYDIEKLYAPKLFDTTSDLKDIGIEYILCSMTKHQVFVVKTIANHMLKYPEDAGIVMNTLYEECIDNIGITSIRELEAHLKEAKDHKLIAETRNHDSQKVYSIQSDHKIQGRPAAGKSGGWSTAILEKIVEFQFPVSN